MTSEQLATLAGLLLSMALIYVPRLAPWYDGLSTAQKVTVFLGALLLGALLSFGASCAGITLSILLPVACTKVGAIEMLNAFLAAMIAGAGGYVTFSKLRPKYALTKKFDSRLR